MYTYKMIIAFDGTNYSGWQIQPNGISIQEVLQNVIRMLVKEDVDIIGSGRTDAGVHAIGQVAHFRCYAPINTYKFFGSVNALLPKDIRLKHIEEAPVDFHARYSAIRKTYHYHLHISKAGNPFNRLYSWHINQDFDLALLKKAAEQLIGTFDFTTFTNKADHGCAAHDPVRTMHRLNVNVEGEALRLEFTANGFLYKMVRNITGTLVEIALGKRDPDNIPRLLAAKDRCEAGIAAPPQGLFLMNVDYPSIS